MAKTPEEKQEWLEAILKERERRKGRLINFLVILDLHGKVLVVWGLQGWLL